MGWFGNRIITSLFCYKFHFEIFEIELEGSRTGSWALLISIATRVPPHSLESSKLNSSLLNSPSVFTSPLMVHSFSSSMIHVAIQSIPFLCCSFLLMTVTWVSHKREDLLGLGMISNDTGLHKAKRDGSCSKINSLSGKRENSIGMKLLCCVFFQPPLPLFISQLATSIMEILPSPSLPFCLPFSCTISIWNVNEKSRNEEKSLLTLPSVSEWRLSLSFHFHSLLIERTGFQRQRINISSFHKGWCAGNNSSGRANKNGAEEIVERKEMRGEWEKIGLVGKLNQATASTFYPSFGEYFTWTFGPFSHTEKSELEQ